LLYILPPWPAPIRKNGLVFPASCDNSSRLLADMALPDLWHARLSRNACPAVSRRNRPSGQGTPGRPAVPKEVRELIRTMSRENPIWGAPRIYGELLKLGIEIGEISVSKYMVCCRKPPSQTWRTFLENHVKSLVSVDFFAVPTIRFQILYVFLVLAHERRRIVHFALTDHPTKTLGLRSVRSAMTASERYKRPSRSRVIEPVFVTKSARTHRNTCWSSTRTPSTAG
jgi:hypothetical protein